MWEINSKYGSLTVTGSYFVVRGLALIPVACDCGKRLDIRPSDLGKRADCGCGVSLLLKKRSLMLSQGEQE